MIEFKNVSKVYDNDTEAIRDFSLKIEQGEFVFVVGASGAGKSTFLKLMMREENVTSGDIWINDFNLPKLKRKQIPKFRRSIGVVFQDFRLIPKMTVFDNIAFAMRVVGARESEIRKRVPHALELVALSHKARNYPAELSGGQQQRVALARALVNKPKLIIADEPTGNVDPEMSYEIVDLLNRISQQGTTVVMVTHAHDLVDKFNQRKVVIENGRIVKDTKTGFDITNHGENFSGSGINAAAFLSEHDSVYEKTDYTRESEKDTVYESLEHPNAEIIDSIHEKLDDDSRVQNIVDDVLGSKSTLDTFVNKDRTDIDYSVFLENMENKDGEGEE